MRLGGWREDTEGYYQGKVPIYVFPYFPFKISHFRAWKWIVRYEDSLVNFNALLISGQASVMAFVALYRYCYRQNVSERYSNSDT